MDRSYRKDLRLKQYDYTGAGYYFVTICTEQRQLLFQNFVGADLCVRPCPDIPPLRWLWELQRKYPGVLIDAYAIMPDHVHFLLAIPGGHTGPPLPQMVQWYKTQVTNDWIKQVRQGKLPPFQKRIWQRNYYEHVIRNDTDLKETRQYIENNPLNWMLDKDQE
jgi:REP element-mobilizing transposase RayT